MAAAVQQPRTRPQPTVDTARASATIALARAPTPLTALERELQAASVAENHRSAMRGRDISARGVGTPHLVNPLTTRATTMARNTVEEGQGLSFPFLHSQPGDTSTGVQLTAAIRTAARDADLVLGTVLVNRDRPREERQRASLEGQGDHTSRAQQRLDLCRAAGNASYSHPDSDYLVSLTVLPHLGHGLSAGEQEVWTA